MGNFCHLDERFQTEALSSSVAGKRVLEVEPVGLKEFLEKEIYGCSFWIKTGQKLGDLFLWSAVFG